MNKGLIANIGIASLAHLALAWAASLWLPTPERQQRALNQDYATQPVVYLPEFSGAKQNPRTNPKADRITSDRTAATTTQERAKRMHQRPQKPSFDVQPLNNKPRSEAPKAAQLERQPQQRQDHSEVHNSMPAMVPEGELRPAAGVAASAQMPAGVENPQRHESCWANVAQVLNARAHEPLPLALQKRQLEGAVVSEFSLTTHGKLANLTIRVAEGPSLLARIVRGYFDQPLGKECQGERRWRVYFVDGGVQSTSAVSALF